MLPSYPVPRPESPKHPSEQPDGQGGDRDAPRGGLPPEAREPSPRSTEEPRGAVAKNE